MVAGHLQIKRGYYHIVLNYKDEFGQRKTKWRSTGLTVKGNKKSAQEMLIKARMGFDQPQLLKGPDTDFADFLLNWLQMVEPSLRKSTVASYSQVIKGSIVPYFREYSITVRGLTPEHLQNFYTEKLKSVKASTVLRYHANIHTALKYAVKIGLIASSPANRVDRPKAEKFTASFLDVSECISLYHVVKGTQLEFAVMMGIIYGLRRSEIVGLRWQAIDFHANSLTINHIVTSGTVNHKRIDIVEDNTKSQSSYRTFPLVPKVRHWLLQHKEEQKEYQRLCGKSYCNEYLDYVYVDQLGCLVSPDYITRAFKQTLCKHNLRQIRFHDLRHTCASLLLASGVAMKQIQEWLGHSDFSTTANIYAHLDYHSKISSANMLLDALGLEQVEEKRGKTNS